MNYSRLPAPTVRSTSRTCAILPALLVLPWLSACRSAAEYRAEADAEVYSLIEARRDELFSERGPFSIERPEGSLRMRMESGEWIPDRPLTLLECIEIAAENNREVRDRKEGLYRAALDLTLERWRYGWRPFATGDGSLNGTGTDAETASANADLGFTRLLGTGGSILAGIGSSLFNVVATDDGWDLVTNLQLSITQPLLRGAGEKIALESLTQAERDLVYEVRSFERFRRTFSVQVASEIYDVLSTADSVINEEANLNRIRTLTERNRALAEAGRQSDIQVDQSRQDELRSENRLLTLRAQLERRYDDFYLFLGLPIDTRMTIDTTELERLSPEDPLFGLIDEIQEEPAVARAREARLDFRTTLDIFEDRVRQSEVTADALRAGLDFAAGVGASSETNKPFSFNGADADWSVGFAFELPVDRIPERNAYRNSLIAAEAARRNVEEQSDTIEADVRSALRNLIALQESYEIQVGATLLAERRVESAQLNLEAGRASTRDLLEAQNSLLDANNATTRALIDLTLSRLDMYLELEVLRVDEEGIRVELEYLTPLVDTGAPGAPQPDGPAPAEPPMEDEDR